MATFNYLTVNIIDALNMFEKAHKNVFIGAVVCSAIEFLGRCIRDPNDNKNGFLNFQKFIDDYLLKEDLRYQKYEKIIYQDLRHGSAHSVLPKGGVSLLNDAESNNFHLNLLKNKIDGSYHLWIYTPKLLNDLRSAIYKFVESAQADKKLENNYIQTLKYLEIEGQNILSENLTREDFNSAKEIEIKGDIIA